MSAVAISTDRDSALGAALERVGDRWTLLVVDALLAGPRRFNDLQEALAGIAPNVLSQRLRHLEHEGLVVARPYSRRPPRAAYELTGPGHELAGALRLLTHWGARTSEEAETPRHEVCGTALETRWYCPTCARTVADDQSSEVRWL
jgi:DNA-binding HxlR family transcriptional regulator